MNLLLAGWCLALVSILIWPALPPMATIWLIIPAIFGLYRRPFGLGLLLGLAMGTWQGHRLTAPERALAPGSKQLVATVVALPTGDALYQRTRWRVESVDEHVLAPWQADEVQLGWYNPPALKLGQRFELQAKLTEPHGVLNQGGGNRRQRLLASGITATGYVREGTLAMNQVHFRQGLVDRLQSMVEKLPRGDLIRALVLADRRGLTDQRWQALRDAGLLHLVAISGLHLSIVAGLALLAGRWVLPRIWPDPAARGRPLVWLAAAALVLGYGYLAGFALPTRRAALMVVLALLLLWRAKEARPWEILLRAAALVLLMSPLAAMGAGFWLSFGAVAALLILNWLKPLADGRWAQWRHLAYLQLGLTLVLVPVQVAWFGQYSLNGIWANLLLLPYFTFIALPGVLLCASLALVAPDLAPVLQGADWLLWPVTAVAELATGPLAPLAGFLTIPRLLPWMVTLVAVALCWVRPWRGWPWQAALCVLPLALSGLWSERGWWLHLLDVGQGLSVVVERQGHFLLYDTGARFPSGNSYANLAVLPFLRYRGANALDLMVLSHGDNDHAGGAAAIRDGIPVALSLGHQGQQCAAGPETWAGLRLQWWQAELSGNNGSCTLLLSDGRHHLMLPGDVESEAEQRMLKAGVLRQVDLLVSPHHGSRSSSGWQWLSALAPDLVLIPAAHANRWDFPHPEVTARYEALGAHSWVAGREGQLSVYFPPEGEPRLTGYRRHRAPWWYNRLPGPGPEP